MDEVPVMVGTATRESIRYVVEDLEMPPPHLRTVDATLEHREWDVTDPTAQRLAAEQELGDLSTFPRCGFQWFIYPENNSAVLAVFRQREQLDATD